MNTGFRFALATAALACIHLNAAPALPDLDRRGERLGPVQTRSDEMMRAEAHLRERVPGVGIERHPITESPRWISAGEKFLTTKAGPAGVTEPIRIVKEFVDEHANVFGHNSTALENASLIRDYTTAHNGLRTIVWQQKHEDIAVLDAMFQAHVTRDGELANVAAQFLPRFSEATRKAGVPAPRLSATDALALAAQHLDEQAVAANVEPVNESAGAERKQRLRAPFLRGYAQARLTWVPMDGATLRLCWDVALKVRSRQEVYRVLLDADSGEVLIRRCQTFDISNASYRVFTGDSPTPFSPGYSAPGNASQPATVSRTLVTLSALNTNASPNGWINDGVNETTGNNVDASTDLNADDVLDLPRPQGSPNRVFDFSLNLNQEPGTYQKAAVVNLFYWCNWVHDRLYELGFNEAAGNFQANNFGKGGLGGDSVRAEAQDGEGVDNANFNYFDASDGEEAWIQMYLFTSPTPNRDGDLDTQIMIHEYVHGLSARLVGAGVGLSGKQPKGMAEGWCDFYALALLSTAGEDLSGTYAKAAYATKDFGFNAGGDNYYFGIRRFPYSTDLSKNPLTFKDIDPAQWNDHPGVPQSPLWQLSSPAEVHNIGEVWCAMLWDARANLINKLGFTNGNQRMLQYVTDGMKLAPANPTFVQARDAILQAEQVLSSGTNKAALWAAFAKRGLGSSAFAPASSTTSGVIEDYNPNDPLRIGLPAPQTIAGPHGGSFAPATINYGVTNVGVPSMTWSVTAESPLLVSLSGSTLAGSGGHTTMSVSFNLAGAAALALGTHTRTITFSNHTSAVTQTRLVTFVVSQSLIVAGAPIHVAGPVGGPFAPFTANLKLTNRSSVALNWGANVHAPFQLSPSSGTLAGGGNASLNLSLNTSLAAALPAGTLSNLVAISNLTAGTIQTQAVSITAAARDYTEYFPPNSAFDLNFTMITFLPNGPDDYVVCREPASVFPTDPAGGTPMPKEGIRYDATAEVVLTGSKQVKLFGQSTNRLYVNFYGSISLDSGDGYIPEEYALNRHFAKRRVSGLLGENWVYYEDSKVSWKQLSDRFAATFEKMYVLDTGDSGPNYFQIEWFFDGRIRVTILQAGGNPCVLGLSRGYDLPFTEELNFDFIPEDFSASPSCATVSLGALSVSAPATVTEGNGVLIGAGLVTLPGVRASDLTVSLASSDTSEITVPASVNVPAGATSAVFNITVVNDVILDGSRNATITASAPLYSAGSKIIQVNDNESTTLHMAIPLFLAEGATAAASLWTEAPVANDVFVSLGSSTNASAISFLGFLPFAVIPAGATSTTFQYKAVNDSAITGTRFATLTASVPNWIAATNGMLITDNESTNLSVSLPLFVSEGDDIITNAGQVRISGTLPTNLVVNLSASGGGFFEMLAFGPITILAGQTNASFDLFVLDDNLIEPIELFQVTASAPGFGNGVSGIFVIDNDGAPEALNPYPPHLSEDVPLDADLSWSKTEGELLANGGFEDATLKGWTTFDSGGGSWVSANSSYNPPGPPASQTPLTGSRFALSQQFGNGRHELWQEITIPNGVSNVVMTWSHRLKNFAPAWASNQQFRVEVRDPANQLLATLFSTQPGDALVSDWTNRTASLNFYKGQTIRIAFVEMDELGNLSVSIDDVSVFAIPPAATTWLVYFGTDPTPDATEFVGSTTNTSWSLAPFATNSIYYWQVKSVRAGATNDGPVWQFTTIDTTNRPPSVVMRYPGNNAILTYPVVVTNTLNSLTDDGVVTKVEFWADGVKLGEDAVAPQSYNWTNPPMGSHILWAVAQDSFGARGTSAVQRITIIPTNGILQTLVSFGSTWSYYDVGVNLGTAWRSNSYSHSHWPVGPAQLGYGEGDEATVVDYGGDPLDKHVTTYFRRYFTAPPQVQSYQMRARRDDGLAAYLDGRPTLLNNLAANAAYNAFATADIGLASEAALVSTNFAPTNLNVRGFNLVAAEVHQSSASSVDLSFDLELAAVVNPIPTVTLTSPSSGSLFVAPTNLMLVATALDAYGAVSNVVFLANGAPLATNSVSPYSFVWSNAPVGLHTLRAVVTDNEGATNTSATVVIEIVVPPDITEQPTNQVVYVGGTASFTVTAVGSNPLGFQWRRNGDPIMGATAAMLVLSNVQFSAAGDYTVRVANSGGFVDSAPAMLTVVALPSLNVSYGASRVVLTWAEENGDFHVESTTNLTSPVVWDTFPGGAFVQDGKWTVVLPVEPIPQRFFRLRTP